MSQFYFNIIVYVQWMWTFRFQLRLLLSPPQPPPPSIWTFATQAPIPWSSDGECFRGQGTTDRILYLPPPETNSKCLFISLSLSRQAEHLVPGHGQPWPVADTSEAGGEEAVQKNYQGGWEASSPLMPAVAVAGEAPAENTDKKSLGMEFN